MDLSIWQVLGTSILGGLMSGPVAVAALSKWLGDVWLGRLLEKERAKYGHELEKLRAQLDRATFVTRAHFETEFTAMKEVSQCLSAVKIAVRELNPIQVRISGIIDLERSEQISALNRANQRFREKLEEWAVFLEPAIYDEFDHCHAGAEGLCEDERRGHDSSGGKTYYWDSYRRACQLVRDRMKNLAVAPGT